ncbi:MAG: adenosylcobinamide-GDP ribazoletransferase [Dissulfurimicrobium sp.]|uniref:adenosylcobinamide-GDP ribazoletransferase n=1 Tax=Dissulfurimicrobium TaxID=1769732 RepID=UPI003C719DA8
MGGLGIKALLIAIQFLTIIPVAPRLVVKDAELTASLSYFPLVGLMLGCIVLGIDSSLRGICTVQSLGVIDAAALAFLTRGLHLDGLSDTFDALGSGKPAEEALVIMKDSRIGAFGAVSLMFVLLLKASALSTASQKGLWQVFLLAPCLSRWGLNVLAASSTYARPSGGLGAAFVGGKTRRTLFFSGLTAFSAAWFLSGMAGLLISLGAVVCGLAASFYFKRRFGGVTGDMLGAFLELTEAVFMVAGGVYAPRGA